VKRLFASASAGLALVLLSGCCATHDPWRGCKLCLQTGRLPLLVRQADPGPGAPPMTPHCAPQATSGLPDEPEAVDDLDGLLSRGRVCGPDGKAHVQEICPKLEAQGLRLVSGPAPVQAAATCGEASRACPNQKLVLAQTDAEQLELEFYDDPSSHRPPASAPCLKPEEVSPCYYRLGRVSTLVRL